MTSSHNDDKVGMSRKTSQRSYEDVTTSSRVVMKAERWPGYVVHLWSCGITESSARVKERHCQQSRGVGCGGLQVALEV